MGLSQNSHWKSSYYKWLIVLLVFTFPVSQDKTVNKHVYMLNIPIYDTGLHLQWRFWYGWLPKVVLAKGRNVAYMLVLPWIVFLVLLQTCSTWRVGLLLRKVRLFFKLFVEIQCFTLPQKFLRFDWLGNSRRRGWSRITNNVRTCTVQLQVRRL